ncbi:DNA adenine methylase [Bifidobacterium tibiigranuli]|jgi:DNA adenine methylase|uniref:DNA adenine methylase n=1 Tax=Bifidobacterium tibiigranuli TaxID=2172043 RepID=UPI0026EBD14F|nr:DNA adenine methylase [Bifidobacterium tibiigranuli]MCI2185072.1 DNA adenine methylase [Bifidobacterium tibiigranuli]MCI2203363.1 DNA adenine methylase [Bifidobacterium tibiigranuli]
MPITYTPFRYPGGKSKIFPLVHDIIADSGLTGCTYAEAFCGGAGLAIKLLLKGDVNEVILNDIDPSVFSMWDMVLHHSEELIDFIKVVPLTISEWDHQHDIFSTEKVPTQYLGKAAFYLNRTNRSGILAAGPIGGREQDGEYGINARFNRTGLINKILAISKYSSHIRLYNLDARLFIEQVLNAAETPQNIFANFDPPYVQKGPKLYENSLVESDHREIATAIAQCKCKWMVTYDSNPLVTELYADFDRYKLDIEYSAYDKRSAVEILAAGPDVVVSQLQRDDSCEVAEPY